MAKARPVNPVRDRAIKAFRKACPDYQYGIRTYKCRSRQIIRVQGSTLSDTVQMAWSYADDGKLSRIENGGR